MRFPHHRQLSRPAALLAPALALTIVACGRSAPADTLADTTADPEIAGVMITSPDTVVSGDPGALGTATPTSTITIPPAAPVTVAVYTVQPGDTLSKIAGDHGITTSALAEANAIVDIHAIKPGQELAIPPPLSAVDSAAGGDPSSGSPAGASGGPAPTVIRPEPVDPSATTSLRQP